MYAINATDIPAYAHSLVSDDTNAPTLECDACGQEVDTYRDAHDEPDAAIREFIEHVAYDHGGPATVLEVTRTRLSRVLTTSFPAPRFGEETWAAPAPMPPAETEPRCCDGMGWTGDPRERCVVHYEPLDGIWFNH